MGFNADAAARTVADLRAARARQWGAETEQFQLAARFADHYGEVPDNGPVIAGTERLVQWGGEGTPRVAEFCTLELAAALGIDELAARLLVRDALIVRHRFPLVWASLFEERLRVWQAREVAAATVDLTLGDCRTLDGELDGLLGSMSWKRVIQYLKARVLELSGQQAQDDYEQRRSQRGVWFDKPLTGVTDAHARLDAADAVTLDAQLNRIATILGWGGSEDSFEVRRARALGMLASPAQALQMLQASLLDELPAEPAECLAAGMAGHTCGTITVDPEALLPRAQVVVHLTDDTARTGEGLVRAERIGALLVGWLKDLLAHHRVSVRPVLDADGLVPADAYECPPRMREALTLRNPHEVFPHSARRSTGRGIDLDHTEPYVPGVAGQTRMDNLGPLRRLVHRAKTHGGWRLEQPSSGLFLWRSPLGFHYLVTPSHTWMISDPTSRVVPPDSSRQPEAPPQLPPEHALSA